jgi:ABC-2 type transport system permease protein
MMEPIVSNFILSWPSAICIIFVVPVLTMRLLSEEWRSGTLEVTLTAPVSEGAVVLSKFLACLATFLFLWLPWGLFLVALRLGGGQPFDYFAVISFSMALLTSGAGFVAAGLFFSSLTRNQIGAAVLTFAYLVAQLLLIMIPVEPGSKVWATIISHVAFVDLWGNALQGMLLPRHLIFHLSLAIFWLFATIKVLESRKWS